MTDPSSHLVLRVHAVQRMAERGITVDDVRAVLTQGETIEDYVRWDPEFKRRRQ